MSHHKNTAAHLSLFTHMLLILKPPLTPQAGKGPSSPTLLHCLTTNCIRTLGVSFFPYNGVLSMSFHLYFKNHGPSLLYNRCSFLNEIINILKILSLMMSFTAIHLLYIITIIIDQLINYYFPSVLCIGSYEVISLKI